MTDNKDFKELPDFMFEEGKISADPELNNLIKEAQDNAGATPPAGETAAAALNQPPGSQPVKASSLFSGMVAIEAADAILPPILVLVAAWAMKVKLPKKALQLTQAQKETIAPVLEECLATIPINANNPWNKLLIVASAVYGGKLIEAYQQAEKIEQGEASAPKEKNEGGRPRKFCKVCNAELTKEERAAKLSTCKNEEHRKTVKG